MPTYRNITVSLISQFDVLLIPEYAPPSQSSTPSENASLAPEADLIHPTLPIVTVYIPTYPSSTFWLSYCIQTSSPTLHRWPAVPFYYFKLFVNGRHIVSWGCGTEDEFKGKTMFGIFRSQDGAGALERRVLAFGEEEDEGIVELKVYRARARGRVRIEEDTVPLLGENDGSVSASGGTGSIVLNSAGALPFRHPKRFYKYYLLDSVDHPYATFRYLYRSWDALNHLGITAPNRSNTPSPHSSRSSSPSKNPDLSAKELRLREASNKATEEVTLNSQDAITRSASAHYDSQTKPLPPTPISLPHSESKTGVVRDPTIKPRPRAFSVRERPADVPSADLRVEIISPQRNSLVAPAEPTINPQVNMTTSQPKPSITPKEPACNSQPDNTSPRPKRVSSLLGPPVLFPGALYPTPPSSSTNHLNPSSYPSPTKATFSNTVSLLMAPSCTETPEPSTRTKLHATEKAGSRSEPRPKSPSKFKIAEFLVRRDDDSKGSRHSVGKRKPGKNPTKSESVEAVSEFGKVGGGLRKRVDQDIGVGKENEVLEGVGTLSRNGNMWKEKIRLKGKRKKPGKTVALADSSNGP